MKRNRELTNLKGGFKPTIERNENGDANPEDLAKNVYIAYNTYTYICTYIYICMYMYIYIYVHERFVQQVQRVPE